MDNFSTDLNESPLCIREVYDLWYFLLVNTMSYDAEIMMRHVGAGEIGQQLRMLAKQSRGSEVGSQQPFNKPGILHTIITPAQLGEGWRQDDGWTCWPSLETQTPIPHGPQFTVCMKGRHAVPEAGLSPSLPTVLFNTVTLPSPASGGGGGAQQSASLACSRSWA